LLEGASGIRSAGELYAVLNVLLQIANKLGLSNKKKYIVVTLCDSCEVRTESCFHFVVLLSTLLHAILHPSHHLLNVLLQIANKLDVSNKINSIRTWPPAMHCRDIPASSYGEVVVTLRCQLVPLHCTRHAMRLSSGRKQIDVYTRQSECRAERLCRG
jgi:hypothetical protein